MSLICEIYITPSCITHMFHKEFTAPNPNVSKIISVPIWILHIWSSQNFALVPTAICTNCDVGMIHVFQVKEGHVFCKIWWQILVILCETGCRCDHGLVIQKNMINSPRHLLTHQGLRNVVKNENKMGPDNIYKWMLWRKMVKYIVIVTVVTSI